MTKDQLEAAEAKWTLFQAMRVAAMPVFTLDLEASDKAIGRPSALHRARYAKKMGLKPSDPRILAIDIAEWMVLLDQRPANEWVTKTRNTVEYLLAVQYPSITKAHVLAVCRARLAELDARDRKVA